MFGFKIFKIRLLQMLGFENAGEEVEVVSEDSDHYYYYDKTHRLCAVDKGEEKNCFEKPKEHYRHDEHKRREEESNYYE